MIYIGIDPDIDKCGYAVWDSDTKEGEFKDFYKSETERIIQHYKNKLE